MTANAVASLSLEPMLVLVCVDKGTHTHRVLDDGGVFVVNILAEHQEELSRLFARRAEPEMGSLRGQRFMLGRTGAPILEDCLAFLECRVSSIHDGGDHSIFIGEVVDGRVVAAGRPLVFFRGRYHALGEP